MMLPVGWFVAQSVYDGAIGLLKAMMDEKENVKGGALYGPKGLSLRGYPIAAENKDYETDTKVKAMMWQKSEEAIGAPFVV